MLFRRITFLCIWPFTRAAPWTRH